MNQYKQYFVPTELQKELANEISERFAESEKLNEADPVMLEAKVKLYEEISKLQCVLNLTLKP